jgi:hypothetical protein
MRMARLSAFADVGVTCVVQFSRYPDAVAFSRACEALHAAGAACRLTS